MTTEDVQNLNQYSILHGPRGVRNVTDSVIVPVCPFRTIPVDYDISGHMSTRKPWCPIVFVDKVCVIQKNVSTASPSCLHLCCWR